MGVATQETFSRESGACLALPALFCQTLLKKIPSSSKSLLFGR